MARRSSARLRERNSATPKRVSLSHDAVVRTPRTAPVRLMTVREGDEMPGTFPQSASPRPSASPVATTRTTSTVPVKFGADTPTKTTPIVPTEEEMHPQKHHQSTAKPLEEARWLGFSRMEPQTEPPRRTLTATLQDTPSRPSKHNEGIGSPSYQFTFRREQSLELSPDAKRLMHEMREEAAKIRENMVAAIPNQENVVEMPRRKFAVPKGKKGRFSELHLEQFKKMDSIAGHASAFRTDLGKSKQSGNDSGHRHAAVSSPAKSLKRRLESSHMDSFSYPRLPVMDRGTATSTLGEGGPSDSIAATPSKRVKHANGTPSSVAASAAQMASSTRIPAPTPARVLSSGDCKSGPPNKSSMLFSRSPFKGAKMSDTGAHRPAKGSGSTTPLLLRTPSKGMPAKPAMVYKGTSGEQLGLNTPLLVRSPSKAFTPKVNGPSSASEAKQASQSPLLSRAPLKASIAPITAPAEPSEGSELTQTTLLQQDWSRITAANETCDHGTETVAAGTDAFGGIGERFGAHRPSPVKSILRSPQRLYSTDPAKIAAGTHLATPPKLSLGTRCGQGTPMGSPSARKRVEFSSSTKARHERTQSETSTDEIKDSKPLSKATTTSSESSMSSGLTNYPALPTAGVAPIVSPQSRQPAVPQDFTFRAGTHDIVFGRSPKAPATGPASDRPATIRHVSAEPACPPVSGSKKRKFEFENVQACTSAVADQPSGAVALTSPSVLVHGSKKRKIEFEDGEAVTHAARAPSSSPTDKENIDSHSDERPTKRMKAADSKVDDAHNRVQSQPQGRQTHRLATLGVKPRGAKTLTSKETKEKRPKPMSMSRLNALAQPKRRV